MNWLNKEDFHPSEDDYGMEFVVRDNFGRTILCEWSSFGFVVVKSEPDMNRSTYLLESITNVTEILRLPLH